MPIEPDAARDAEADHATPEHVTASATALPIGRFRFLLEPERWEWSAAVADMHGYADGPLAPTTELVLRHRHPDDPGIVRTVLDRLREGRPFADLHRILDTRGRTRTVVVVGDRLADEHDRIIGTDGFYLDLTDVMEGMVTGRLRDIMSSRAGIEHAKGLLMLVYGVDPTRAFEILAWRSQESNIKVRDLADRLIDAARAIEVAPEIRTRIDHLLLTPDDFGAPG